MNANNRLHPTGTPLRSVRAGEAHVSHGNKAIRIRKSNLDLRWIKWTSRQNNYNCFAAP